MDLLLDRDTHDMVFVNGATPVTQDSRDVVAQTLKIKLLTFLGEWFLDEDIGVPYFQRIFGKQFSKSTVDAIFQNQILSTEGVLQILEYESDIISASRTFSFSFRVLTESGDTTDTIVVNGVV